MAKVDLSQKCKVSEHPKIHPFPAKINTAMNRDITIFLEDV